MTINEETRVALTCPSCGNDQNFLVKTLQMHVVHLDDSRVECRKRTSAVLKCSRVRHAPLDDRKKARKSGC